jgi:hypothetical protein
MPHNRRRSPPPAEPNPACRHIEQHYSVNEVAALWGLDPDTIRPYFQNRSGVLKIIRPESRRKRGYTTLRIPVSVVAEVYAELTGRFQRCRTREGTPAAAERVLAGAEQSLSVGAEL